MMTSTAPSAAVGEAFQDLNAIVDRCKANADWSFRTCAECKCQPIVTQVTVRQD